MTKSPLDALIILYQLAFNSSLKTTLSGSIYKDNRPTGSTLEDLVVNVINMTEDQIQLCTGNVNIYVPDEKLTIGGKEQLWPNHNRLKVLTDLAKPIFRRIVNQQYLIKLADTNVIAEPETGQHYINLRIDFQFFP